MIVEMLFLFPSTTGPWPLPSLLGRTGRSCRLWTNMELFEWTPCFMYVPLFTRDFGCHRVRHDEAYDRWCGGTITKYGEVGLEGKGLNTSLREKERHFISRYGDKDIDDIYALWKRRGTCNNGSMFAQGNSICNVQWPCGVGIWFWIRLCYIVDQFYCLGWEASLFRYRMSFRKSADHCTKWNG